MLRKSQEFMMRFITAKNLSALMLIFTSPYFIHGEYYFYALLCSLGGSYILKNNVDNAIKQKI